MSHTNAVPNELIDAGQGGLITRSMAKRCHQKNIAVKRPRPVPNEKASPVEKHLPRKLVAILYADVVGYSRLMGEDEDATHRTLTEYFDLIASIVEAHRGRVMHYAGDAALAQFQASLDALSSAIAVQDMLENRNENLSDNRKVQFRIGINLGDVIEQRGDIYGDGVNVAARLEALAEPGAICISDAVRTAIGNRLPYQYSFIGEHSVKNIKEPVRAYRVIKTNTTSASPPPEANDEPEGISEPIGKPSLAVKPFQNIGSDPEQDHFANGLTYGITSALSRVPGLALINDETPSYGKSKQMTAEELGRCFNVRYVLKGSVLKYGDRIRVNPQLIEVSTGRILWAENIDRALFDVGDLFDLQDEITIEIVTAMDVRLLSGDVTCITRRALNNPEALENYYRGEQLIWGSLSKPELREAQRFFKNAIELEPEAYAGYAAASFAHWLEVISGLSDSPRQSLDRAMELAHQAAHLGDTTGYSHLVMAYVHLSRREFDKALDEATLAVSDRASCPFSYSLKAGLFNYLGRPAEAIEFAKYALRLTPIHPPMYPAILATAYYGSGRYNEAIAAANAAIKLDQRKVEPQLVLAAANTALDRNEGARAAAKKVLKLNPKFSLTKFAASQPYKEQEHLDSFLARLRAAGLE